MPKSERIWNASLLLLICAGLLVIFARTQAELDLWGHLQWGGAILESGGVTRVDPFSYVSAGYPWTNHEWLGDVTFASAWRLGGAPALLLLKLGLWLLTAGLILARLLRDGLPLLRAALLLALAAVLLNSYSISIRPQAYSALLLTLALLIVRQADLGRWRWLWALPPLFLLWANLHGGFLAGLGLVGVWGLGYLLSQRNGPAWRRAIPPLLLCPLATLANPYGLELWLFLLRHLGERRLEIIEWNPLELHSPYGWAYLIWLGLVLAGLAFSRRPRSWPLLAPLLIAAYMPLISQRFMLFFSLSALLLAGGHIGDAWERWLPLKPPPARRPIWALVLPALAALLLLAARPPDLGTIPFPDPEKFPVAAVALLEESGVGGNLANHFNWGNYLAWHLAPAVKVSVDTRREMAYPQEVYRANLRFLLGTGEWDTLLNKYPTDMVLIDTGSPPDHLLKLSPGWEEIYRDPAAVLYARRDSPQAAVLRQAAVDFRPPPQPAIFP